MCYFSSPFHLTFPKEYNTRSIVTVPFFAPCLGRLDSTLFYGFVSIVNELVTQVVSTSALPPSLIPPFFPSFSVLLSLFVWYSVSYDVSCFAFLVWCCIALSCLSGHAGFLACQSVVCCVRFSTDGTKIAAGSHSCVKVFDVKTFKQLYVCRKVSKRWRWWSNLVHESESTLQIP